MQKMPIYFCHRLKLKFIFFYGIGLFICLQKFRIDEGVEGLSERKVRRYLLQRKVLKVKSFSVQTIKPALQFCVTFDIFS